MTDETAALWDHFVSSYCRPERTYVVGLSMVGAAGHIAAERHATVLFVTHDIEEAIFLGSRVIVMSARPGRIKAEIAVDLPHPRSYKIKTAPEFVRLKERLVEEIRAEALKVAIHA